MIGAAPRGMKSLTVAGIYNLGKWGMIEMLFNGTDSVLTGSREEM
jgi:hypothetical protein